MIIISLIHKKAIQFYSFAISYLFIKKIHLFNRKYQPALMESLLNSFHENQSKQKQKNSTTNLTIRLFLWTYSMAMQLVLFKEINHLV